MKPTHYTEIERDWLGLVLSRAEPGRDGDEVQGVLQVLLATVVQELPELGAPEALLGLTEHQLLHQTGQVPGRLPATALTRKNKLSNILVTK